MLDCLLEYLPTITRGEGEVNMSVYNRNYLRSSCLTSHDMTLHLFFSERSVKIPRYLMLMRYSTTQDEGRRAKGFAQEKTDKLATL